ncbi:MAG: sensor histidine kinase [Leptolyngbyaceae cyanobacterium bins.302]|nr:sensor histidine kinase [Leptolyngbyaceae cyanobacterium bins.302]
MSIPVLLVGEYMVYRKARSSVLTTARYNLMESAERKAEELDALTALMRSQVLVSSQLPEAKSAQPETAQTFVNQLKTSLPPQVQCVQLTAAQTGTVLGSTCGQAAIAPTALQRLKPIQQNSSLQPLDVLISPNPAPAQKAPPRQTQLGLVFSSPIYDARKRLVQVLSVEVSLWQQQFGGDISRQGYSVVLTQDGTVLAHPLANRIGRSITEPPNPPVLEYLLRSAIAGEQDSLHLFEENGAEWLAGYTAVKTPIVGENQQTWVILAIAPIANALHEIRGIQQVLLFLTLGLLVASVLATLFMARELANPLERLGDYALQIRDRSALSRVPKNFKIRELNQLAEALDIMIRQLDERAEELETAWQEAQAANQLKSEFLAVTSHELRTPLNAIIGSVRLIKDGCCDSPEEVLEFLQQADDAAIHLLKIINDLLDISKIEVGQVVLNLQPVDIQALCQQCLRWVEAIADRKRMQVSVQIDPNLKSIVLDEQRVRQMVINLLSNAVKFTAEGGFVKLSAWLEYGSQLETENRPDRSPINPTTPYLCLQVEDSGIGIAPERWHLLFRPFQQVDSSSTRNYEGTGLGLALTKRLAELHGGTLSFDSIPGKGSTFRIWLPIAD